MGVVAPCLPGVNEAGEVRGHCKKLVGRPMARLLKAAGPCSDLLPLALAEVVHLTDEKFQVRRLHLIIVDKWLPDKTVDLLRRSMRTVSAGPLTLNTTPIRLSASSGRKQHQVRFTYGYALDGSTYPCYCVYPERADDHSYQLVDSATGYIMAISQTASMRPLGVAHFYHAFSVNQESEEGPNFREAALKAFDLPEAAINEDKQVAMPWANQIIPAAGIAHDIPAEEDTASVISVASIVGLPPGERREILTPMPRSRAKLMIKLTLPRLWRCSLMKMSRNPRVRKSLN